MPFQVDQNAAVALALADGPVIDTHNPWRRLRHGRERANLPENGIGAAQHPELATDDGAGFATERQTQCLESGVQANRALRVGPREASGLFGEGDARACWRIAKEAPHVEQQLNGMTAPG